MAVNGTNVSSTSFDVMSTSTVFVLSWPRKRRSRKGNGNEDVEDYTLCHFGSVCASASNFRMAKCEARTQREKTTFAGSRGVLLPPVKDWDSHPSRH
jgi:hypothetical protein